MLQKLKENVAKVMIGNERTIELILTCVLAKGHVLLEDVPGTGKTVMAKSLARSVEAEFGRVQFTPDMLPSDVTGLNYFDSKKGEFVFSKGPVFCNILLADEINRATPKTQSSLLECMAERQVTVDGVTRRLDEPFLVIATQNPLETLGTFPLPEAQMDRFMMRLSVGYPDREQEIEMARRFLQGKTLEQVEAVCQAEDILKMQKEAARITVKESVLGYVEDIVRSTREEQRFVLGASPRAMLALVRASQGKAFLEKRDYVKPDDVKAVAMQVLSHRLVLSSEARIRKEDSGKILKSLILKAKIPV